MEGLTAAWAELYGPPRGLPYPPAPLRLAPWPVGISARPPAVTWNQESCMMHQANPGFPAVRADDGRRRARAARTPR